MSTYLDTRSFLRWGWRQLTSMRTALILLLMLGVAAIPGSLFPQRTQNPMQVRQYFIDNPGICLLYTSPSPRDYAASRMPSSA